MIMALSSLTSDTRDPTTRIDPFKDLRYQDLVRLKPKGWLNDELVMAGIKYASFFFMRILLTPPQRMVH
jgi:hypothetical protein